MKTQKKPKRKDNAMGKYLNPGNQGFREILQSDYVDKTGLIASVNATIATTEKLSCVSRPRRFGKSFAAKMLCAYYDYSCDSHALFEDKEIAKAESYCKHLNKYHVISLDIMGILSEAVRNGQALSDVPNLIVEKILAELTEIHPQVLSAKEQGNTLTDCLFRCVEQTGRKFIFVIDEWDALIREAQNDQTAQKRYLNLLREWFKNNNFTPQVIAAAYMTGILPVKKDGSQSAISDFKEYTILDPGKFLKYTGFVEAEVHALCEKYEMPFQDVKKWYDGYDFPEHGAIYNPYSVMCAMNAHKCRSYWQKTSAAESLMTYINMDFEGMQEMISRLIAGEEVEVRTEQFENDFEHFKSRNDVLTLLIHLGYLTYREDERMARIPNEEVRLEFEKILEGTGVNRKWTELIAQSRKLLEDTLAGDSDAVVEAIEKIRDSEYAPTFYNDEQALRYVIKFAYIAAIDQYLKVEELPSGKGIADVIYLPKRLSRYPALIVELKWNQSGNAAIAQIKDKNYPAALKDYGGEIVLAGINYDVKTKKHTCVIERV